MGIQFTNAQLDAIRADGTVLVAAAAGSGKTAVLVERIIRRFCNKEQPLLADRALIVTFTNAAAAELKLKIESRLRALLNDDPDNELLRRQNLLIKNAAICTIDAFCISMLREHFNALSIPRDFKIADTNSVYNDREKLLDNLFLKYFAEKDEVFLRALDAVRFGYDESYLKSLVLSFYDKSCAMPYQKKWLSDILKNYQDICSDFDGSDFVKALYKSFSLPLDRAADLNDRFNEFKELDPSFFEKHAEKLKKRAALLNELKHFSEKGDWDGLREAALSMETGDLRKNYSKEPPLSMQIVAANKAYKDLKERLLNTLAQSRKRTLSEIENFTAVLADVLALTNRYADAIFDAALENGEFTFDQIEHLTLQLFSEDRGDILKAFDEQFDAILVDEYQDTSNLQDELFRLLSARKGALFMVGDVKQSIYGFRNANPDNFLNKKDRYTLFKENESPAKVLLTGNFRSRDGICRFINYIFEALMTKANADMDYNAEEALVPMKEFPDNRLPAVEVQYLNCPQDENRYRYEADYLADYILKLKNAEPFIDDGNGSLRRANYRDIVLLMRSPKTCAKYFVKAFREKGIPVSMPAESFGNSEEITAAVALIKVLCDLGDSISLLTLMRARPFHFTDSEIAEIRMNSRGVSLYANLTSNKDKSEKVGKFLRFLKRATTLAVTLPADELLTTLFDEASFFDIYSATQNGALKKANLHLFIEYAAGYSQTGSRSLKDFVRYIESDKNNNLAANVVKATDSVQIMTIHNSKGLQFPVTILCGLSAQFNKRDSSQKFICDDKDFAAFDYYDKNLGSLLKPPTKLYISEKIKNRLYKEELRLLYVAMTRAEDHLTAVITQKNLEKYLEGLTETARTAFQEELPLNLPSLAFGKSYADWLTAALMCHRDGIGLRRGEEDFKCNHYDCSFAVSYEAPSEADGCEVADEERIEPIPDRALTDVFQYQYELKDICHVPAKISVTDLLKSGKSAELAFKARPGFLSKTGLTPAERGTATHRFMQYCDYGTAANNVDSEVQRLLEWQYITEAEANAIDRESVASFFKSHVYMHMLKAESIYKEYQFLFKLPLEEIGQKLQSAKGEYTLIQGVADCVAEFEDSLLLLDFKTDKADSGEKLKQEYKRQIDLYTMALEEIFNKPVKNRYLYSFYLKQCIEL